MGTTWLTVTVAMCVSIAAASCGGGGSTEGGGNSSASPRTTGAGGAGGQLGNAGGSSGIGDFDAGIDFDASCGTAITCAQAGANCGPIGDGCGGILQCGDCVAPETCGGAGTASVCGAFTCTPQTCA